MDFAKVLSSVILGITHSTLTTFLLWCYINFTKKTVPVRVAIAFFLSFAFVMSLSDYYFG